MTGVSWMLPFVIAGAVIMGISRIGASLYGIDIWDSKYLEATISSSKCFINLMVLED